MTLLKIALIGLGHVFDFQRQALLQSEDVEFVAAYDLDKSKRAICPKGVKFYDDFDELIKSNADILFVSTPNVTHYSMGKKVLNAGCPLVLEKPCCDTSSQMNELIDLATAKDLFFFVAMHAYYANDVEWLVNEINGNNWKYGPLTGFISSFYDPYIESGDLQKRAKSLGGSWFDSGINALSVIGRFVAPESICADDKIFTSLPNIPCSDIQATSYFSFEHNSFVGNGTINTNWTLGLNQKQTVLYFGTTMTKIVLNHSDESVSIFTNNSQVIKKSFSNENPRLVNHYINLFKDLAYHFKRGSNNLEYSQQIHNLLY